MSQASVALSTIKAVQSSIRSIEEQKYRGNPRKQILSFVNLMCLRRGEWATFALRRVPLPGTIEPSQRLHHHGKAVISQVRCSRIEEHDVPRHTIKKTLYVPSTPTVQSRHSKATNDGLSI
jgi:hypothetical protein